MAVTLDIARVKAHLAHLAELEPGDPTWWRAGPTWSEEELLKFEAERFKLPADYRLWLREIGDGGASFFRIPTARDVLLPLRGRPAEELARAGQRFRITRASSRVTYPLRGVLHLGTQGGPDVYLVLGGRRAGDVWIDATCWDGQLYREGTFAELTEAWMTTSRAAVEAIVRPRLVAELEAGDPVKRFEQLCAELAPWLRVGAEPFTTTFAAIPIDQRTKCLDWLVAKLHDETRWTDDPCLAGVAAVTLGGVIDLAEGPAEDAPTRAVDAIFDRDPPDLAPGKIDGLLGALATAKVGDEEPGRQVTSKMLSTALAWIQNELARRGRVDEARRLWELRPFRRTIDWVELARFLIGADRCDAAFALADALLAGDSRRLYDQGDLPWARAWLHYEAGARDTAIEWMMRATATNPNARWLADLDAIQGKKRHPTPDALAYAWHGEKRTPVRRSGRHRELVALLYGIANKGDHMADAAIRALAYPAVARYPQQRTNHTAHVHMGQALAGQSPPASPPLVVSYRGHEIESCREALARRILAHTGDIGISVE